MNRKKILNENVSMNVYKLILVLIKYIVKMYKFSE